MKQILKTLVFLAGASIIASCGSKEDGQLMGAQNRPKWKGINPYGMVYVPSGTLHIGPSDQDVNTSLTARQKSISIQGFFMDDTEITNNEYRQFIEWVRDSIAHKQLGHMTSNEGGDEMIDWTQELDYSSPELEGMHYAKGDRFAGKRELDTRKLEMEYEWYDWKNAAYDRYKSNRKSFIKKEKTNVFPDTLVWVRDFV